jgi:hypothetical protein
MVISRSGRDEFHLQLSGQELATLSNCLNEVINGLYVQEFPTRMGVSEEYAKALLRQMLVALDAPE